MGGTSCTLLLMMLLTTAFPAGQALAGGYGTLETRGSGTDEIWLLKVGGSRYEMGFWYGRLLADQIAGCAAHITAAMAAGGMTESDYIAATAAMWNPAYFDTEAYEAELQGMADGCSAAGHPEMTFEALRRVQLIPDMSEVNCSLFCAWGNATVAGHLYQLRNLDWTMETGIQNYPVVAIFEPDDGHVHAIIGFAGSLGISGGGINQHGIAQSEIMGAFNDAETLNGVPFPILLRESLYHDSTLAQALTRIQGATRTNNYYYGISGPDGAEMTGRLLLTSNTRCDIYAENQSVSPHPKYGTQYPHPAREDLVYWTRHNGDRNQEFYNAINARWGNIDGPRSIEIAQAIQAAGDGTLLSVIYNATAKDFWAAYANGLDPAPDQGFIHFDLSTGAPPEAPALPAGATPLDVYVATPDPSYGYVYDPNRTITDVTPTGSYTAYVLEMTSQTWREQPEEVDKSFWKHWLVVIVPDFLLFEDKGMLWIDAGDNTDPAPDLSDPNVQQYLDTISPLATGTGSVLAILRQVPSEPLVFPPETHERSEDAIIAHTFKRFGEEYQQTGDPNTTWPALLPMVKGAVRAMDTVQDFLGGSVPGVAEVPISRFVVSGGSKRGWTTWLTAAVDQFSGQNRVCAIAPVVIDLLNLDEQMDHHYLAYGGGYADAVQVYVQEGVMDQLRTEAGQELLKIVDPFEYRDRLASLPKFMMNSPGDRFFVPDSAQFYFHDLPGDYTKWLRYVPNTDHDVGVDDPDHPDKRPVQSLAAFYASILLGLQRPHFTWTVEGANAIRVETSPWSGGAPTVRLWQGYVDPEKTGGVRDFRRGTVGEIWTSTVLPDQGGGVYVGQVDVPEIGWRGFFVELTYTDPVLQQFGDFPQKFTTKVRIVPELTQTVTLDAQSDNEAWGHVDVDPAPTDPNVFEYVKGTTVTLTAGAETGYEFWHWQVFDPNHPGDPAHADEDANNPLTIALDTDREVKAVFGPNLVVTVEADPNPISVGFETTLTAEASGGLPPYTYDWLETGETESEITVIPATAGAHTYHVTVTDNRGQTAPGSVKVTVREGLVVAVKADPAEIASGGSSELTATATGGTKPYTYSWQETGDIDRSITVSPTEPGNHTYTVTVTDSSVDPKTATESVTVSVASTMTVSVQADPEEVAAGQTSTLTVTVTGGKAPYEYEWNTEEKQATITVAPTTTTKYSVTVIDKLKQRVKASVTVSVPGSVSVALVADPSTIVAGQNVVLTAKASGGAAPYTYTWGTTGSETIPDGTGATYTATPTSDKTTYTVSATDSFGQPSNEASVTITVVDVLTATAEAAPDVVVPGGETKLTASPSGGKAPYFYVWTGDDGGQSIADPNARTARASPTQTTEYTVTVTDSLGQEAEASVGVEVASGLTAKATAGPTSVVSGGKTTLTATATGGVPPYEYVWWPVGLGGRTLEVNPTGTTTYDVTVKDNVGQQTTASVTVSVVSGLTAKATANPTRVVSGGQVELTAEVLTGGVGPFSYHWPEAGQDGQTITVSPTSDTYDPKGKTVTYSVIAVDSLGQRANAAVAVTVKKGPVVAASATPDTVVPKDPVTLTASASGGTPPYGNYVWSTGQTGQTVTVYPAETTDYTVAVRDAEGNPDEASVTVTVASAPNVTASCEPNVIKAGDACILTARSSGGAGGHTYTWSDGQTGMSIQVWPTLDGQNATAGEATYSVTVTDALKQTAKASVKVAMKGPVSVEASAEPNFVIAGVAAELSASASGGKPPYTYAWSNGGSDKTITVAPTTKTEYTVTATDTLGQQATASVTVGVGNQYALTVGVHQDQGGSVKVDPPGGRYGEGDTVKLTARAEAGWVFAFWSTGDEALLDNPLTMVMNSPKEITAVFLDQANQQQPATFPIPPEVAPACGTMVGTGQLGLFWALCWLGLGALHTRRVRKRSR